MSDKKNGLNFECIVCHNNTFRECDPPKKWYVKRYPKFDEYRFLCPDCGAFTFPDGLCPPEQTANEDLFIMFAACENAYGCYLYDLYSPDCETPVIQPKCLYRIFRGIDDISDRLGGIEKFCGSTGPTQQQKTEKRG